MKADAKQQKAAVKAKAAPPEKAAKAKGKGKAVAKPPAPKPNRNLGAYFSLKLSVQPSFADLFGASSSSAAPAVPIAPATHSAHVITPAKSGDEWLEEQSAADHCAAIRKHKHPSSLCLSPSNKRLKTGREALEELQLEQQRTSGYKMNCLAFSVMLATRQIGTSSEAQSSARDQSEDERYLTHEVIMKCLPPMAGTKTGPNGVWWAGQSCASLIDIFQNSEFMNEAHVHGFANRLNQTIVIVDVRMPLLVLDMYMPGYEVSKWISMREAVRLRNSTPQPIWVLLELNHFSALVPLAPTHDSSCSSPDDSSPDDD